MTARSLTITLELAKAPCSGCGQVIFRFSTKERWRHAIGYGDERCKVPPVPLKEGPR